MKKQAIMLAMVASMSVAGSAVAAVGDIGTASFQWAGTVPAATDYAGNGYWLVSADGQQELSTVDTQNGVLVFENIANTINLKESSVFSFKVVSDADGAFDPAVDTTPVEYYVSLDSISTGVIGLVQPGDSGYFDIQADGQVLNNTSDKHYTAGTVANIKVAKNATATEFAASVGEVWQVAAQVAVSTTAM